MHGLLLLAESCIAFKAQLICPATQLALGSGPFPGYPLSQSWVPLARNLSQGQDCSRPVCEAIDNRQCQPTCRACPACEVTCKVSWRSAEGLSSPAHFPVYKPETQVSRAHSMRPGCPPDLAAVQPALRSARCTKLVHSYRGLQGVGRSMRLGAGGAWGICLTPMCGLGAQRPWQWARDGAQWALILVPPAPAPSMSVVATSGFLETRNRVGSG